MEENKVNSFTFYRDYYNLIDTMPAKDKKELLVAITDYVFKDIEPNLNGHNLAIFNTLKNQLNVSKHNSKRSSGNGAPKGNQNAVKKQTEKQTKINPEEKPKTNKTSVLSFMFYISNFKFINSNNLVISKLEEWFKYKQERKEYYKETGIQMLLKKVDTYIQKYGYEKVLDLIDECMASNYKGIIWERLEQQNSKHMASKYQTREEVDGVFARFMEGEENE